jgi:hypothetical protein
LAGIDDFELEDVRVGEENDRKEENRAGDGDNGHENIAEDNGERDDDTQGDLGIDELNIGGGDGDGDV